MSKAKFERNKPHVNTGSGVISRRIAGPLRDIVLPPTSSSRRNDYVLACDLLRRQHRVRRE
jgi:hypothetical protein